MPIVSSKLGSLSETLSFVPSSQRSTFCKRLWVWSAAGNQTPVTLTTTACNNWQRRLHQCREHLHQHAWINSNLQYIDSCAGLAGRHCRCRRHPPPPLSFRSRELWMFLSALMVGLFCLFSNRLQAAAMSMPAAFSSYVSVCGEVTSAALHAFFRQQRLRPFLLYTTIDRMVVFHLFGPHYGWLAALMRSLLAGVLSVLMCWALEVYFRRRFVLEGLYS